MTTTDRIVLRTTPGVTYGQSWSPWPGAWPPPPRLLLIGGQLLADPADQPHSELEKVRELAQTGGAVEYQRYSHSAMPEPAGEGEHWCRAAEYVLATS